jgi:hypothetical protein
MPDLSPDAAALIRSGRTAFRPDASDRDRVLQSLRQTLGEGVLPDEPGPGKPAHDGSVARFSVRAGRVLGGFAALAVGAAVVLAPHLWRTPARGQAVSAAAPIPLVEPEPSADLAPLSNDHDRAPEPPRSDHAPSNAPSNAWSNARPAARSAARPTSDSLPEEVRLLSRAEQQLNDGLGEDALRTLAEHERRFPRGALAEERVAARVEALCTLGRFAEARTDLTRLARAHPGSAHLDVVRRSCGAKLDAP